ncbi:MAG: DNA repair protein RadC [Clostridia bacterium]|nr:DNA repair protein RadC [Clostridia bacterium]
MDEKKSIHAGHRERLRERFRKEGLDGFSEHEVLELLLTYAIPQRDVNPLAHALVNRFGSLSGVLDAHESELTQVPGIGRHAALFLTLMPRLFSVYQRSDLGEKPRINTIGDAKKFCNHLFTGIHDERFYIICLDQQGHVLHTQLLYEGTIDEVTIYPRQIVEMVLHHHAYGVMFVHNHPSGQPEPSQADIDSTEMIIRSLQLISVRVIDHLIFTKETVYSMIRQSQYNMQEDQSNRFSYVMSSSQVPGRRGTISDEVEMIYMTSAYGTDKEFFD